MLGIQQRLRQRFPFLLQSAAPHSRTGRYDLLLGDCSERLNDEAALDALAAAYRVDAAPAADEGLPFAGGWFFYLAYEAAALFEPVLRLPASTDGLPRAVAVRCHSALIVDHVRGCCHAVTDLGAHALRELDQLLASAIDAPPVVDDGGWQAPPTVHEDDPQRYLDGVRRVQAYLAAGDAFQVNLSRQWRTGAGGLRADQWFARLRRSNPAPFAALAMLPEAAIISSSPERLVLIDPRADGMRVETRPIAGTRPRGATAGEDEALRRALINHVKERAEHVMLIDLERNDLGRVCQPGSIQVDELMSLESYTHVHHIVSNICGRLRPECGPAAVLRAVFPGGTITGCPKVRVMEIIAEIEGQGRGPYTGSVGYLSRCGRMDSNILIRTMVLSADQLSFRAGGGIVMDSDPVRELAEARSKAKGLLMALAGQTAPISGPRNG